MSGSNVELEHMHARLSADHGAHEQDGRRGFLRQVIGGSVAVGGASLLAACANGGVNTAVAQTPAPESRPSPKAGTEWDLSWMERVARKPYKMAFDSPEVFNGAALAYGSAYLAGYKEAYGSDDVAVPVLILRHAAAPMVLNDGIWERMGLGESLKLKDPTSGEPSKRNPFVGYQKGDKYSMTGAEGGLDRLIQRGAVVLACNYALKGYGYRLKQKEPALSMDEANKIIRDNVLPGVIVMPNGIFAVGCAQEAGAKYIRVLA